MVREIKRGINYEKLREVIDFKPHPKQWEILRDMGRFTTIVAGRRFGKTMIVAYVALRELLVPGRKIWIVAPTYDLSQKVWAYVLIWINKAFSQDQFEVKTSGMEPFTIKTKHGSFLKCKSADNAKSLLGEGLDLLIVDEAGQIPETIWTRYLRGTIADPAGKGQVVFISTPTTKNWFYENYHRGKKEDWRKKGWRSFHYTSLDNPYFSKKEFETLREESTEDDFRREYMAEFVEEAGDVFRNIDGCISGVLMDAEKGHIVQLGVDLGKHRDWTVITAIDRYDNKVIYFDRFKELDWNLQKARIILATNRIREQTGIAPRVILDSTAVGDPILDDLRKEGVGVTGIHYASKDRVTSKNIKHAMVENLMVKLERRGITFPNIPELISELKTFKFEMNEIGTVKYSAPSGKHDDCVNSLMLCVWRISNPIPIEENDDYISKHGTAFKYNY